MRSFLKVVVAVGLLVVLAAIVLTATYDHAGNSSGNVSKMEAPLASPDAGPTYHESDEVIDPYDLSKNPYKLKGHSGVLDTTNTPLLMNNGTRMRSVQYPGGCLQFKKMLDEHTAVYEVMVYQELLLPAGELAVILPNSDPPKSTRPWRILVEGPFSALTGAGMPVTLTAVKFEGYYTSQTTPETSPEIATATTSNLSSRFSEAKVKWTAMSRTADSITGDIELSPSSITIVHSAFPLTLVRSLHGDELQAATTTLSLSATQNSEGRLYRTLIPASVILKNGNTACGNENVAWLLTLSAPGNSLGIAMFSGDSEPTLQEQAIATSKALCGTFSYSWNTSNAAIATATD